MPYKDKAKQRASWTRWCERNRNQVRTRTKSRKKEISEWFQDFKKTLVCSKCPENHPKCLDFHHIDKETKTFSLAASVHSGYSKERIMDEVAKCIVLCSNCHRKHHSDIVQ